MVMSAAQFEAVQRHGIKPLDAGAQRFPFGIPNGWFAVAESGQVVAGQTRNAHYFGRDLVIWRAHDGAPHVVDAYCPHLGAHLGVGAGSPNSKEPGPGTVDGACLVCPFHGWRFDGNGRCVEIPYAETERIPVKAAVRAYPTMERAGLILAWHHASGEPPGWDLPDVAEFASDDWVGPIYTDRFIAVALQVMMENDVDRPHFVTVHGAASPPTQQERFNGRTKVTVGLRADGSEMIREVEQMGFGLLRVPNQVMFVFASTPVDEGHTHQRWVFAYPKAIGDEAGQQMVASFASSGIYQDIPIWEHMAYREHPVLVKGDGNIMAFRQWAAQFYS